MIVWYREGLPQRPELWLLVRHCSFTTTKVKGRYGVERENFTWGVLCSALPTPVLADEMPEIVDLTRIKMFWVWLEFIKPFL